MSKKYDLIVIGGGPSGMMTAGRAAQLGARVLLLEKNTVLGKKLSISGGGRCNITNAEEDVRKFLDSFPQSKDFLFSPFSKFSSKDTFSFFQKRKLPLTVESRKRAFPETQNALDVTRTMERYLRKSSVEVRTGVKVSALKRRKEAVIGVKTDDKKEYLADNIAIATGGFAAPDTGSTGDGFKMLGKVGHTVHRASPNIVPLVVKETWVHELAGTTLSFMRIKFQQGGKTKIKKLGKILFTHFGISGPLILNSAYEVKKLLYEDDVTASIDLFPDTQENELDKRIQKLFNANKNKLVKNVLPELLPKALSATIVTFPDNNLAEKEVNSVTKDERKTLVKKIKDLTFTVTGTLGFKKAVVADGGVELKEINFKNMSSNFHSNLYLLGDILNINRPSGGYSLQLCWTTGWVAGTDIGEKIAKRNDVHNQTQ